MRRRAVQSYPFAMRKLSSILLLAALLGLPLPTLFAEADPGPAKQVDAPDEPLPDAPGANEQSKQPRAEPSNAPRPSQDNDVADPEKNEESDPNAAEKEKALADARENVKKDAEIADKPEALQDEARPSPQQAVKEAPTPVPVNAEQGDPPSSKHEAALQEIESLLEGAEAKARELVEIVRAAEREKAVAEKQSTTAKSELADVRKQLNNVKAELAQMKDRDVKNREQLETLESKLGETARQAEIESRKLATAAEDLSAWETRTQRAESGLVRAQEAMQTSLRVARETKAQGLRLQEKLDSNELLLAEGDGKLATALASLREAEVVAAECQTQVAALQEDMKRKTEQLDAAAVALKKVGEERDASQRAKLVAVSKIEELQATVSSQKEAEISRTRENERLAISMEKLKARLDEILIQREELHDHLTILRNEFAQFRKRSKATADRLAREGVNQLQAALARESQFHQVNLEERDARLAQLEKSLKAKEEALQAAYRGENETASKLKETEKARQTEAEARQSLTKALERLRADLKTSQAKAQKLSERMVELEALTLNR